MGIRALTGQPRQSRKLKISPSPWNADRADAGEEAVARANKILKTDMVMLP